ncbi:hypothetical protein GWI33_011540 [Rhynchophorus ferrugineus]|uniref:Uncharacterized protein n=1 Tax=Rhynchophorus ferrugineus TaxID=354439 RepID=A0A834IUD7_RHYFE|nr:hypothetical protein GWI33_011540 [Rhynchophorus ferrugineus]
MHQRENKGGAATRYINYVYILFSDVITPTCFLKHAEDVKNQFCILTLVERESIVCLSLQRHEINELTSGEIFLSVIWHD